MSWLDRLTAGLKKTADKVADNITGIVKEQALDTATLDDIEEALIASDLGPEASKRIREGIAGTSLPGTGCGPCEPIGESPEKNTRAVTAPSFLIPK